MTKRRSRRAISKLRYARYLESALWLEIRSRVLRRDGHLCRVCGEGADAVHHRDYSPRTMSGQCLDRLLSLCSACHDFIHRGSGGRLLTVDAVEDKLAGLLALRAIAQDVASDGRAEVYRRTIRRRFGLNVD